jgi:hypothetical protein
MCIDDSIFWSQKIYLMDYNYFFVEDVQNFFSKAPILCFRLVDVPCAMALPRAIAAEFQQGSRRRRRISRPHAQRRPHSKFSADRGEPCHSTKFAAEWINSQLCAKSHVSATVPHQFFCAC